MCCFSDWLDNCDRRCCTRGFCTDQTLQTNVHAETEPRRERSGNHVPSLQNVALRPWKMNQYSLHAESKGKGRQIRHFFFYRSQCFLYPLHERDMYFRVVKETDTSPGSTLHGLPVEDLNGASRAGVDLVVHHVFETLVVSWAQENLRVQLPARVPVEQYLQPSLSEFVGWPE